MVDLERIENKILELESFFEGVVKASKIVDNSSFGAGAMYGLKIVKKMKSALIEYTKKPENKILKQLYADFTAISRGVEGFNDHALNEKFRAVCGEIFNIQENLRENIKWELTVSHISRISKI